jgi:hypothetical protein
MAQRNGQWTAEMQGEIDHLAVAAATLEDGVAWVEEQLGVTLAPGGVHPQMGTHNRLLGLGPGLYLEVIAIDPEAAAPGRPRWFDLDRFSGPPRLTNWIVRVPDLDAALREAPEDTGSPMALKRGDLEWRMAVPDSGRLPFTNLFPALIAWQGSAHPADRLPDAGCRLRRLEIRHPEPIALNEALSQIVDDDRIAVLAGDAPSLLAEIDTPEGPRELSA